LSTFENSSTLPPSQTKSSPPSTKKEMCQVKKESVSTALAAANQRILRSFVKTNVSFLIHAQRVMRFLPFFLCIPPSNR
jgi:hypothetical protein